MSSNRIYLSSPHMAGTEIGLVLDAFASNWIAPLGPHVDGFEREFAKVARTSDAVALSSGTAALHLALRWLKLEPADEVVCSTFTFSASVNPILYERAKPIFVDSDLTSWNMDPGLLAEALADRVRIGKKPKAVILVHLYGQSADLDPIVASCERYGIPLIEDAAEALGATYKAGVPGAYGLCGVHSFNGNKIITTSGGGMLVSNNAILINKARFWASQSRDTAPHYQHSEVGFNYRLSNILAAVGRGQLAVLEERVNRRRRICEYYQDGLRDLEGLTFMPEAQFGRCTRWLTAVVIDPQVAGLDREAVRLTLEKSDIESRPVWKPMHLQPLYSASPCYGGSVSKELFEKGLCLPSGSNLSNTDLDRVIELLRSIWSNR